MADDANLRGARGETTNAKISSRGGGGVASSGSNRLAELAGTWSGHLTAGAVTSSRESSSSSAASLSAVVSRSSSAASNVGSRKGGKSSWADHLLPENNVTSSATDHGRRENDGHADQQQQQQQQQQTSDVGLCSWSTHAEGNKQQQRPAAQSMTTTFTPKKRDAQPEVEGTPRTTFSTRKAKGGREGFLAAAAGVGAGEGEAVPGRGDVSHCNGDLSLSGSESAVSSAFGHLSSVQGGDDDASLTQVTINTDAGDASLEATASDDIVSPSDQQVASLDSGHGQLESAPGTQIRGGLKRKSPSSSSSSSSSTSTPASQNSKNQMNAGPLPMEANPSSAAGGAIGGVHSFSAIKRGFAAGASDSPLLPSFPPSPLFLTSSVSNFDV